MVAIVLIPMRNRRRSTDTSQAELATGTPVEEADPDCRGWRRNSSFIPSPVFLPMSYLVPICV
jgi:hypothetical protein